MADWIVDLLPSATHFYDLFAGGCAVTHCALQSGKFQHVHANDITDSVTLFEDALNGDIDKYEPERFRSREDFFAEKDYNPFVRIVYSFANDQKSYLYSRNIEAYKRAVHEMLYAPTPNERRLKFKKVIYEMFTLGLISGDRYRLESAENIQITPPRILTDYQHMESTARVMIGSDNTSGWRHLKGQIR